ncbi:MAG: hypothetical protein R2838_21455 [Caldilineaceae bacterium]
MIENLDWNVGRIRTALDATGLAPPTSSSSPTTATCTVPTASSARRIRGEGIGARAVHHRRGTCARYAPPAASAAHQPRGFRPDELGTLRLDVPDWMEGTDYSGLRLPEKHPRPTCPIPAYLQLVVPTGHADSIDRPWRGVVTTDGWKVRGAGRPAVDAVQPERGSLRVGQSGVQHTLRRRAQALARLAAWIAETGDEFALPIL